MHGIHDHLADYYALFAKQRWVLGVCFYPLSPMTLSLVCCNKAFLTSHSFINSGVFLEPPWVLYHHTQIPYHRSIVKSHLPLLFPPQKFRQSLNCAACLGWTAAELSVSRVSIMSPRSHRSKVKWWFKSDANHKHGFLMRIFISCCLTTDYNQAFKPAFLK